MKVCILKIFLSCYAVLLFCITDVSGGIIEDAIRIRKTYDKSKYSFETLYKTYDDSGKKKLISSVSGKFIRIGSSSFMRVSSTDILSSQQVLILIDNDARIIALADPQPLEPFEINPLEIVQMVSAYVPIRCKLEIERGYLLLFNNGFDNEVKAIKLFYSTTDFSISKIVFIYHPQTVVTENGYAGSFEVSYLPIEFNVDEAEVDFGLKTYVGETNGVLSGKGAYCGYEIMDNRQLKK